MFQLWETIRIPGSVFVVLIKITTISYEYANEIPVENNSSACEELPPKKSNRGRSYVWKVRVDVDEMKSTGTR